MNKAFAAVTRRPRDPSRVDLDARGLLALTGRCASAAFLFAACSVGGSAGEPPGIFLRTSTDRVEAGERITLILHNETTENAGYNLCTSALTQQVDGEWVAVPSDRICTMELRSLEPGARDSFTIELPAELEPGTYRFETGVEHLQAGGRDELATEPFDVMR